MNKCRICLECKRNVCSIHESDQGLSYASMITLITGIKISNLEKSNVICLPCRRKLKDFLEFKHLIERSDHELCQQSKVIKFNTVEDLKGESLPGLKYKPDIRIIEPEEVASYNNLFQNKNDCIQLNDTLIRRLKQDERKCVPIEEFLSTIKSDSFEEDNYVDDYEQDASIGEEYNYRMKKKTSKRAKHSAKSTGPLKEVNNIHIKPVLLKDVRVLKTFIKPTKRRKRRGCKPKETICPFCGKICKSIKSHILRHTAEKKFKCESCTRSFYTNVELTFHTKAAHGNIKETYRCDNCIFSCTSRSSIMSHMEIHMKKPKQFSCAVCNKEFKRKSALQRHKLTHDISARSIQCRVCSRTFLNRVNLNHHSRVHTGERPYKCELCSQPYSYKRDFNRHCLKKHGVLVDRRPVYVMNDEVLRKEKALMKDLMLHIHGLPTVNDPLDSFSGPQMSQAFAKAVTMMQNGQIPIDVHL